MQASVAAYFRLDNLECSLCHDILDQPVHLPCYQTLCSECQLTEQRKLESPCCGGVMHDKEQIANTCQLTNIYQGDSVQCEECQQLVKASQLEEYVGRSCQSTIAESPAKCVSPRSPFETTLLSFVSCRAKAGEESSREDGI